MRALGLPTSSTPVSWVLMVHSEHPRSTSDRLALVMQHFVIIHGSCMSVRPRPVLHHHFRRWCLSYPYHFRQRCALQIMPFNEYRLCLGIDSCFVRIQRFEPPPCHDLSRNPHTCNGIPPSLGVSLAKPKSFSPPEAVDGESITTGTLLTGVPMVIDGDRDWRLRFDALEIDLCLVIQTEDDLTSARTRLLRLPVSFDAWGRFGLMSILLCLRSFSPWLPRLLQSEECRSLFSCFCKSLTHMSAPISPTMLDCSLVLGAATV